MANFIQIPEMEQMIFYDFLERHLTLQTSTLDLFVNYPLERECKKKKKHIFSYNNEDLKRYYRTLIFVIINGTSYM